MVIDQMGQIEVINEKSGERYEGSELEYFIDDQKDIGEVYLDGNLIYQSTSIFNEHELNMKFKELFAIHKQESTDV